MVRTPYPHVIAGMTLPYSREPGITPSSPGPAVVEPPCPEISHGAALPNAVVVEPPCPKTSEGPPGHDAHAAGPATAVALPAPAAGVVASLHARLDPGAATLGLALAVAVCSWRRRAR